MVAGVVLLVIALKAYFVLMAWEEAGKNIGILDLVALSVAALGGYLVWIGWLHKIGRI